MKPTSEKSFETAIEESLLSAGYTRVASKSYDQELAIFPEVVLGFIQDTQAEVWEKLEKMHGEKLQERVLTTLGKWMSSHGVLNTLRHGFKCYGKTLRVAFFKPAHRLNKDLENKYKANVLGITRQLYFSKKRPQDSIDVVLSVNGIPLITMELKNALSGQTVEHAIKQYRTDRDPRELIFDFKKRSLVHFAVDTDEVFMTTRMAGSSTYFLPFNQGNNGGAGNPPASGQDYRTAYLWEETLQPDSFLDLLARFIHLQIEEKRDEKGKRYKKETMIFPRFHQLKAVRELVADAEKDGVGHSYLVEHSAGSGKSNTIAWLAHRLSSLHDNEDERIFESVIVVTDRRVLDKQLQNTIYQFEHRQGVVQKIDENSRQLAEALESGVPIIITTIQKFPFVTEQLEKLAEERGQSKTALQTRKCAVIIDEAHSSQSGETASDLKAVLGGEELKKQADELAKEEGEVGLEKLFLTMAKRGQQPNLSYFAFTATPKHKTLKIFGDDGESRSKYTMRQAIEEGFIMDVLKNYVTYKTYYKLLKKTEDDPNVERKKAARELGRFMRLHPHNIAQKTRIMVEHFLAYTRHKIGGHAKAMVVTGSRLEAVKYKNAFDKLIEENKYPIKTLVAFSGKVQDDKDESIIYTEVEMNNGIKEKNLPDEFAGREFQVLLVADKYQTGFDQPLLHTMYVDKRLSGIQAVQTLSRLNRNHPLKEDTFVLDFYNNPDEIQDSFKQYYEGAQIGEQVEPERLYEIKAELDEAEIYFQTEIQDFCRVFFASKEKQTKADGRAINATMDLAVQRFKDLQAEDEDASELIKSKITAFKNLYSFLSQVIPYQDSDLEKLYSYLKYLTLKLPKRKSSPDYSFDGDIQLTYYRQQKISEGSISLSVGYARKLDGQVELGSSVVREDNVPLSTLVDKINERFGDNLNESDQLFFDQLAVATTEIEAIKEAAQGNPRSKYQLVLEKALESILIDRMELNEELVARYLNDKEFRSMVEDWVGEKSYGMIDKTVKY